MQKGTNTGFTVSRFPLWPSCPASLCLGGVSTTGALLVVGLMAFALPAHAESNLLENSPFLAPESVARTAQQTAPLELRSIVKEGGQYEFSLYDSVKKQSTWVHLNEPGSGFLVKTFDAANNAVTVEQHNRTYTLALKEAKIVALVATIQSPVPNSAPLPPQVEGILPGKYQPLSPQELLLRRQAIIKWQKERRNQDSVSSLVVPPTDVVMPHGE
jgi:hypothetical protein